MPANATPLGAQVQFDPDRARKRILAEFKAAGCNARELAERLGVNRSTLWRWAKILGISERLGTMRAKTGAGVAHGATKRG